MVDIEALKASETPLASEQALRRPPRRLTGVFDRELCRELALKRMLPGGVGDLAYEERFRREYRALASIAHPGVPQVHHSGRAPDGSP